MPKLKQFSGKEIIKILESYGFINKRTTGSHARVTFIKNSTSYHITIPLHDALKKGTLHGIIKNLELHLGHEEVRKIFFTN